jgi:NADH-quinone oxidoreductase subunit E
LSQIIGEIQEGWRELKQEISEITGHYRGKKGALIPLLQEIQNRHGYLSQDAITFLAEEIKVSENEIYGVATFYTQFKFKKPGLHQVKVCLGTACHVRGGAGIMDSVERELGIPFGETTEDGKFSLERVACVGCCALAPVVVVDENVHGKMAQSKVNKLLDKLK